MQLMQGNFCNLMQTGVSRCKYIFLFRARFERSPLSTYTSLGSQDTFNEGVTNRVSSACIEAILQQNLCILPLQKYLRRNVCKRNPKARTLSKRALRKTCGEFVEKNSECIEEAIQSDNPSSLPRVSASPQLKHFHQPSLVLGDCVFPQFQQATRSRVLRAEWQPI